jgi:ATP-dependent DNA ligase
MRSFKRTNRGDSSITHTITWDGRRTIQRTDLGNGDIQTRRTEDPSGALYWAKENYAINNNLLID